MVNFYKLVVKLMVRIQMLVYKEQKLKTLIQQTVVESGFAGCGDRI
jgi:hypothetical protein